MPLEILALLVVVGVGGVVLAIHLSGGTVTASIPSGAAAAIRFAEDFPEASVTDTVITANAHSAVLALANGDAGVVHAIGDRFLTRYLGSPDVFTVESTGSAALLLRLGEISWSGTEFVFSSQAERDKAAAILKQSSSGDTSDG